MGAASGLGSGQPAAQAAEGMWPTTFGRNHPPRLAVLLEVRILVMAYTAVQSDGAVKTVVSGPALEELRLADQAAGSTVADEAMVNESDSDGLKYGVSPFFFFFPAGVGLPRRLYQMVDGGLHGFIGRGKCRNGPVHMMGRSVV